MADSHSKTTVRIAGCIMRKKCGIRTLTGPMRLLCSFDWDNFLHPISLFTLNTLVLLVNTGNCVHIFFIYFIFFWDDYPAHQVYQDQWKSAHIANIYIYIYFTHILWEEKSNLWDSNFCPRTLIPFIKVKRKKKKKTLMAILVMVTSNLH